MEIEVKQVFDRCTIDGNNVKLPDEQLERKLYQKVAKALQLIGGKWTGGKTQAFVFPHDPTELLGRVVAEGRVNLKKEFQFFATPPKLADYLVELAELKLGQEILEPSAGQGAVVLAILRKLQFAAVFCYELMDTNQVILKKIDRKSVV